MKQCVRANRRPVILCILYVRGVIKSYLDVSPSPERPYSVQVFVSVRQHHTHGAVSFSDLSQCLLVGGDAALPALSGLVYTKTHVTDSQNIEILCNMEDSRKQKVALTCKMSPKIRLSGSTSVDGLTAKLGLTLEVVTTCLETEDVATEAGSDGAVVNTVEEVVGAFD